MPLPASLPAPLCPLSQAAASALLLVSPLSGAALAGEFDLLAEGTPTTYVLDDASILNKTTRKSVSDDLKALEVRKPGVHQQQ